VARETESRIVAAGRRGADYDYCNPSARAFDHDKLAFPFEQFEPVRVFGSIADVVTGALPLYRNVITPDHAGLNAGWKAKDANDSGDKGKPIAGFRPVAEFKWLIAVETSINAHA
jgi:hypothetical protein